jgi:hypothetical protein
MIVRLPGSLRSLWSVVIVLVGLLFSLLGLVMMTMPRDPGETQPSFVGGLIMGAVCFVLGVPFIWGGARMGVYRHHEGLMVRELFGRATTYQPGEIAGFGTREEEHHSVPLMLIQPAIVLADGSEVWISSLSSYRVIPGARRQASAAAKTMGNWTRKPLIPEES